MRRWACFCSSPQEISTRTSLIWFTVWSSVVHAAIMGVQAVSDPAERGHLLGDVPALILVAVVLAALTPRGLHTLESGGHTVPA